MRTFLEDSSFRRCVSRRYMHASNCAKDKPSAWARWGAVRARTRRKAESVLPSVYAADGNLSRRASEGFSTRARCKSTTCASMPRPHSSSSPATPRDSSSSVAAAGSPAPR
eukprot:CAMPEP_0118993830 /NCGR_PEP_ID=MMETSP1173-20130426/55764_1 /TAXON_ID=1034831 /ORGANISM="Rhizochromulina marina cf, Strain CCMP1243" /LENGTH=110 /DNA_ID=CAMNT_0006945085 /DNA_START=82 /DNA_END=410 /DNA_ORIENTATION=-